MKKILFILGVLFILSPSSSFAGLTMDDKGYANLDQLKFILEQAKDVQKKIIEQEEVAAKYPYKIKVVYPNGGEQIGRGDSLRITWNSVDSGVSKINIFLATSTELYNAKNPGTLIARDVPVESIFYPWTVPENMNTGSYKILIRNSGQYRVGDFSDGDINIIEKKNKDNVLEITSIKGGETLITGRANRITWKMADGGERFVNIRLVKEGSPATSTASIPTGLADLLLSNANGIDWKIPAYIPTGEYRLKIFGVDTDCTYCLEPQAKNLFMTEKFKIVNADELPKKITLFSPNGDSDIVLNVTKDEKINVSLVPVSTTTSDGVATTTFEWATTTTTTYSTSTEKISWFTPLDIDSVDIYLRSVPSGRSYLVKNNFTSILSATSSRVEIDWAPDRLTLPGERLFMRICRTGTNYCDESDRSFSITASSSEVSVEVTKTEPNTPEYNILREILNKIKDILVGGEDKEVAAVVSEEEPADKPAESYLPYNFTERMSVGLENNNAVKALQEALAKEGLFEHEITGNFGPVTEKSVQEFQTKYELEPSGSVGPATQAKLNELYGVKQDILQTVHDIVEAMNSTTTAPEQEN